MLRLTEIAFIFVTAIFSEEFECFDDADCIKRFGADSRCTQQKRGPSCDLVSRCTNPNHEEDYQSCECKHLYDGKCISDDEWCAFPSFKWGVCPEREGMMWECCTM